MSSATNHVQFDEALLRSLLGPPIAFNRALVPVAGSIKAALLLSQMIYWANVLLTMPGRSDGWFYKSTKEWLRETGMTRRLFFAFSVKTISDGVILGR